MKTVSVMSLFIFTVFMFVFLMLIGCTGEKTINVPIPTNGTNGLDGAIGPQGPSGNDGQQGDKGDTGDVGPQGSMGNDGIDGAKGDTGDVGPQGPAGQDGIDGQDASSTMTTFSFGHSTTCQLIDTHISAKKQSTNSNDLRLYFSNNCTGSYETLEKNQNEIMVLSNTMILMVEGDNSTGITLKKLVFN